MVKTQWKTYQLSKNICDCSVALERFLSNRVQTIGLLQLILPVGWRISKQENKVKYIERDVQCVPNDLNNVYMALQRNKVHIYQYFESDFNKDFITVRMNVIVNEYDLIQLL